MKTFPPQNLAIAHFFLMMTLFLNSTIIISVFHEKKKYEKQNKNEYRINSFPYFFLNITGTSISAFDIGKNIIFQINL